MMSWSATHTVFVQDLLVMMAGFMTGDTTFVSLTIAYTIHKIMMAFNLIKNLG